VCACALIALAGHVSAQTSEDSGIWVGGFANGKLPPSLNNQAGSWRLWMDVQLRFGDDASQFSQAVLRPGIGYALGRAWTIWGGYAYIKTDAPYATSPTAEHRLWEQASWSGAVGATALSSRTRLEQRFVSTGADVGWRLREFVKIARPLASRSIWSAVVSDEYFVNLNTTDFGATGGPDRNRFFVGPGARLSKAVVVEIGYLNQYTFRSNGPDKNDHLLATNVFWSF
jgi:hypothetical protein